ncbi:hypothetical protein SteCoe_10562 [Stentor coeruleus]|uniref:Ion transport domain-containing protein n=1 Tax=Stentor coeruleus TaxID=5963 RepID=A0A1R2CF32_9CILI|nr:hypothetical protein SteCoe_10562 [Stentor coeruleus]
MNLISTNASPSFNSMWSSPFGILAGRTDPFSESTAIQSITYFVIITALLIIMLNMIISILGDVFDEFQLDAEIYNFSEMAEVILEIEQILSLKHRTDNFMFLYMCINAYEKSGNEWKGKVIDLRELIRVRFFNDDLKPYLEQIENRIDIKVKAVNDEVKHVKGEINTLSDSIDQKVNSVNDKVNALSDDIKDIKNNIQAILKIISK